MPKATRHAGWMEKIVAGKGKLFWFILRKNVLMWFDTQVVSITTKPLLRV